MKRIIAFTAVFFMLFVLSNATLTARASRPMQGAVASPTPGPDGRIIYKVQEGNNCIQISLLFGVPVAQLRELNRLDENCTLSTGQNLILGVGGPAIITPTAGPSPTPAPVLPTPTPEPGFAKVCVLLYDDLNGDAIRQETEEAIPGGAISITGSSGQLSQTSDTVAGLEPICFTQAPEDSYSISAAAPQGYNPTTQQSANIDIKAGEEVYIAFGAQESSQTIEEPSTATSDSDPSSLLGIIGAGLFLGGVGLGLYYWLVYSRAPKFGPPGPR